MEATLDPEVDSDEAEAAFANLRAEIEESLDLALHQPRRAEADPTPDSKSDGQRAPGRQIQPRGPEKFRQPERDTRQEQ